MKIKQEIICIRKMGIKGWQYAHRIKKYHVSRKKVARKNTQFDRWKHFEIRRKNEFDIEVEAVG